MRRDEREDSMHTSQLVDESSFVKVVDFDHFDAFGGKIWNFLPGRQKITEEQ